VWAQTDDIAEKLRQLDVYVPGSMARFLELADIEESVNVPTALSMLSQLKTDNDRFIIHLRAGIAAAENANEPAVSNFLQDLLGAHQKKAWMLRSIVK
jgi:starvation-inducible DNA-binding protein